MDPYLKMKPIGRIHSCYGEKFGIPRQPGLVPSATATLELLPPCNTVEAVRGLSGFSHLWIIFLFHQTTRDQWKATVRPPRLGGNERIGVFASRSNFRPNPIGLSVVKLLGINGTTMELSGGDFLDGTPVLDIKPYIPYADAVPHAEAAFAAAAPAPVNQIRFTATAEQALQNLETEKRPALRQLICETLAYNPQPAYQTTQPERIFGTRLFDLEIRWKQEDKVVTVIEICTSDCS
ncbi:MAG: tRNA (N6-threonylcarbamoyladenosine(37)-N6)-methyltransferase TrmO [Pontiellaceae bacterium]|nr:tRNA (N6-threonylcarbamoyladenosine(37)-N6)-methyltransferase TrmO [Pontiellaceae bacterium]